MIRFGKPSPYAGVVRLGNEHLFRVRGANTVDLIVLASDVELDPSNAVAAPTPAT